MFRLIVAALAVIGLVSLFFGGGTATAVGVGLLAIPLIIAKVFFFVLLLGFIAKGVSGGGRRRPGPPWVWQVDAGDWQRRSRRPSRQEARRSAGPSREDQFEEWHRLAHARKEVDDWAPPVI